MELVAERQDTTAYWSKITAQKRSSQHTHTNRKKILQNITTISIIFVQHQTSSNQNTHTEEKTILQSITIISTILVQ